MPFNKSDLISQVASGTSTTKRSAEKAINAIFASITKALKEGQEARFIGFGTFVVQESPARQGRNPRTGEAIQIAVSKKPTFRAGLELKKAVNEV